MPGLDRFILALLKKNKNLYANHKEVSIRLVNALARNIREEKAFIDCFEFIKGLVSGEHNAKKKIIYFQMLKGFVLSIKNNNLNPKFMN